MHRKVNAGAKRVAHALSAVGMDGNLQPVTIGLVYRGQDLLVRQRRDVDHLTGRIKGASEVGDVFGCN
jgi:hypothetical protein